MTEWIVIPKWDEFQHYRTRTPPWIKNYTDLLHSDDYLALRSHPRLVLHGLWLLYASAHCMLPRDTTSLTRQLNLRVTNATLEVLNHAGFIEFVASKPLARRYHDASASRKEVEKKENAHAREPVDKAPPSSALKSGLLARFDNWVKYEGYEYVDDADAFIDELRRRKFILDVKAPLASELLERARDQVHA